jgi:hypothetical protein
MGLHKVSPRNDFWCGVPRSIGKLQSNISALVALNHQIIENKVVGVVFAPPPRATACLLPEICCVFTIAAPLLSNWPTQQSVINSVSARRLPPGYALQKYFGEPCNVINFSARNTFRRSNCHALLARQ